MKKPDYLIIVSTQTGEGKKVTKDDIINYHTKSRANGGLGFNRPAFDFLVPLSGELVTILPEGSPNEVDLLGFGEGEDGLNGQAKVIAYAGGMTEKATKEKDTRTQEQKETLADVVRFYAKRFPKIQVGGWNEIPGRSEEKNPGFDVKTWLEEIGIPEENYLC